MEQSAPAEAETMLSAAAAIQPDRLLRTWMSRLPDTLDLADLMIPGTHESCARGKPVGWANCQTKDLDWQLYNGVRFLDLRCRRVGSGSNMSFTLHHGDYYLDMMLGDALNHLWGFLQWHPTETLLLRISQTKSDASAADFRRTFETNYLPNWRNLFHISPWIPNLRSVRGKVVLMTGWPYIGGLALSSTAVFDTQDEWNAPMMDRKKAEVTGHMNRAASATAPRRKIYMNYTSANDKPPFGATPWSYAEKLNPHTLAQVNARPGKCLGIVPMDYINRHNGSTNGDHVDLPRAPVNRNAVRQYQTLTMKPSGEVVCEPYSEAATHSFYLVDQNDGSVGIRHQGTNRALSLRHDGIVLGEPYVGSQHQSFRIIEHGDGSRGVRGHYNNLGLTLVTDTGQVHGSPNTTGINITKQADGSTGFRHYYN
ncbi:phosphatidylinositol-specific phospholipase C [Kitasatospora sp. NPDC094016]|uniref:phosphatidylinositol-specific phospholipase C n=1 Tax=Kitasatospora sp. NPDC094016 TaxID=3154986 RepID=UPI00331B3B4F